MNLSRIVLLLLLPSACLAQSGERFTSARTEVVTAVGVQNFLVGRLARDCRATLQQPESFTKEMAAEWQQKNAKYLRATSIYFGNLLSEIERTKGEEAKKNAMAQWQAAVNRDGTALVTGLMTTGSKEVICTKYVEQIRSGSYFNFGPHWPLFTQLEELVMLVGE